MFKPVPTRVDYVQLEHDVQAVVGRERHRCRSTSSATSNGGERWSFIDGPITANNPMGVHHAWGRSYKDLYNRFWTMRGRKLRYQNGFDCQGLWIEVEVEKELGFTSKKDIETLRHRRVRRGLQGARASALPPSRPSSRSASATGWTGTTATTRTRTRTTTRSGPSSRSAGRTAGSTRARTRCPGAPAAAPASPSTRSSPRATRTSPTSSVYLKFPITGRIDERGTSRLGEPLRPAVSLLVWTTTPWTLAANIAAAVNPELTYVR